MPVRGPGTVIDGRYELQELIGAGGMGEVYRARDLTLERTVALKLMRPAPPGDDDRRRRFLREARSAARLEHPGIVTTYDAGETAEGVRYISSAYFESESLAARLNRGPLPRERALEIALRVAEALAYAHDHGIVHRDLKPANILLAGEREAKLIDFGLAKQTGASVLTRDGALLGTPAYMAPEQVTGDATDGRTDVWALGVVLYEMLAGQRPFGGDDPGSALYAIVHAEPPDLEPASGGDDELQPILARALAKSPADRYPSAHALAADLRRLVGPLSATAVTLTYPVAPRRGARRTWRLVGLALLLAVVTLAAVWLLRRDATEPIAGPGAAVAILPFANVTGDEQMSYVGTGLAAGLISQLSGLPGVTVVGRSRAWAAAEAGPASGLAERLGINVLVEGEVHREVDGLRVDVRTSDAASAVVLWSDGFAGEDDALYDLQQSIARALARVLSVPLSPEDRRRLSRGGPSADAFYRYLLGLERLEQPGNPRHAQLAADHFREAIRLEEGFALFHAALSQAIHRQHLDRLPTADLAEAERQAQRAIELDPLLGDAHLALARAQRAQGRYADSIAGLRRLLARHPKPDEAFRELGYGYEQAGDLEAAAGCYENAATLGPENWFNWNALGAFQAVQGDLDAAAAALEKAAALAPPGVFWPRLNLGGVKIMRRDYAGAIAEFEATGSTTSDPQLASNMGTAYFFLGRLGDAERLYRLAIGLDPGNHVLHGNLGDALLKLDRPAAARAEFSEALRLAEEALAATPRDDALLRSRPLYAAKAGDCAGAVAQAEAARPLLPRNWQNHLNLAMAFAMCGEPEDALAAIEVCLDSGFPAAALRDQDEFAPLRDHPEFARLSSG